MNKKKRIMLTVGQMCKKHREVMGLKQSHVADATGYSDENISSFETGRTNNMIIFLWYIDNGLFSGEQNKLLLHNTLTKEVD